MQFNIKIFGAESLVKQCYINYFNSYLVKITFNKPKRTKHNKHECEKYPIII